MLLESEVDVYNFNGAIKYTEVISKDTWSNLSFGFPHQTQLPFPHTKFRGMDRSDSFFMGKLGNYIYLKLESWKRLCFESPHYSPPFPQTIFFLKTLLKALWSVLLFFTLMVLLPWCHVEFRSDVVSHSLSLILECLLTLNHI